MKNKGLFSFMLFLVLLIIILELSIFLQKNESDFEKTKNELIKLEESNKQRTIIEENIDKIIKIKLEEQILKNNSNIFVAQKEINTKLFEYLKERAKATDIFFENEKELSIEYLNQNSVISIIQIKDITYAEYFFTSNILKTNIVSSKIGNKIKVFFRIPVDYTIKVVK